MATYGGQNIGARKLERIDQGIKACVILGAIYSVVAFAALYLFSDVVALLFVDAGETEILNNTRQFLIANCLFYFPLALINIFRFMIQGLGYSKLAIIAGVCEMVARSVVGFCLVPLFGYMAVCLANPIAWLAADAFLLPAYRHVMGRLRRLFGKRDSEREKETEKLIRSSMKTDAK